MSETSPSYHELQCALASAAKLIQDLPPHDVRTEDEHLRLRAFVLICHAAIEEYLENLSAWVVRECRKTLLTTGHIPHPLLSLKAYYSFKSPFTGSSTTVIDQIASLCDEAIKMHQDQLYSVNGIKTKDQDALFLPLGVKVHSFDKDLSQQLNGFGERRGDIAHKYRIRTLAPKAGMEQTIRTLNRLIIKFDNHMCDRILMDLG